MIKGTIFLKPANQCRVPTRDQLGRRHRVGKTCPALPAVTVGERIFSPVMHDEIESEPVGAADRAVRDRFIEKRHEPLLHRNYQKVASTFWWRGRVTRA